MKETKWKWNGKFPVRIKIVDADGHDLGHGFTALTPECSTPHLGKEGTAVRDGARVKITLEDNTILYGEQCWWEALPPKYKPDPWGALYGFVRAKSKCARVAASLANMVMGENRPAPNPAQEAELKATWEAMLLAFKERIKAEADKDPSPACCDDCDEDPKCED